LNTPYWTFLGKNSHAWSGHGVQANAGSRVQLGTSNSVNFFGSASLRNLHNSGTPSVELFQLGVGACYEHGLTSFLSLQACVSGGWAALNAAQGIPLFVGHSQPIHANTFFGQIGGGLNLARGALSVNLEQEFFTNISFQVANSEGILREQTHQTTATTVVVSSNLMRLAELVGGRFQTPSFTEFLDARQFPTAMVYADAVIPIAGSHPSFQRLEARITPQIQCSEETPLGGILNAAVSIANGREAGAPDEEAREGPIAEIEEYGICARIPGIGLGIFMGRAYGAGIFLANEDGTIHILPPQQDHEPGNNTGVHSHQFFDAIPLSFQALRLQWYPAPWLLLSLGTLNGSHRLRDTPAGLGVMGSASFSIPGLFTLSASVQVASMERQAYQLFNLMGLMCYPYNDNCSLNYVGTTLNAGVSYVVGHSGGSMWNSLVATVRYNHNAHPDDDLPTSDWGVTLQGEFFHDPDHVRSAEGASATRWQGNVNLHTYFIPSMSARLTRPELRLGLTFNQEGASLGALLVQRF